MLTKSAQQGSQKRSLRRPLAEQPPKKVISLHTSPLSPSKHGWSREGCLGCLPRQRQQRTTQHVPSTPTRLLQIKCLPYLHNPHYIVTFQVKNAAGLSLSTSHVTLSSKQVTCARRWSRSKTGTRGKGNRHTNSSFPTVYGPTAYGVDTCVCNDCANLLVFGAEGAPVDAFMS